MSSTNDTATSETASRPILIIGAPRSGTTLLTTMLNTHPDIFLANEAKVFVRILPDASNYPSPVTPETASTIIDHLENQELHYLKPLPTASEILADNSDMDLATFIRLLFETLASRENKKRWGEKTAVAYRQLQLICDTYPDAQLLAMERDPYEMAASYIRINPKWGALGAIIHWLDFKRAVAREVSPASRILAVSYSALVAEPERELKKVCKHIGEAFDDNMLNFHQSRRAASLASNKTYEGPARPLYHSALPPDYLRKGLRGKVIRHLIDSRPAIEQRTTLLYLLVKTWVYMGAAYWELGDRIRNRQH